MKVLGSLSRICRQPVTKQAHSSRLDHRVPSSRRWVNKQPHAALQHLTDGTTTKAPTDFDQLLQSTNLNRLVVSQQKFADPEHPTPASSPQRQPPSTCVVATAISSNRTRASSLQKQAVVNSSKSPLATSSRHGVTFRAAASSAHAPRPTRRQQRAPPPLPRALQLPPLLAQALLVLLVPRASLGQAARRRGA